MFSDKIVCAIRVMNLLAYSPPGQRSARGIDAGFLKELLGVEYSLYKSVINTLIIGNICYTTARMVYLGKGVERVTVYDLMYLFHKGLPMGAPRQRSTGTKATTCTTGTTRVCGIWRQKSRKSSGSG